MNIKCPNCSSLTNEIRECDKCGKMGCHKCLRKSKNEWVCLECKNQNEQSNIFNMFN